MSYPARAEGLGKYDESICPPPPCVCVCVRECICAHVYTCMCIEKLTSIRIINGWWYHNKEISHKSAIKPRYVTDIIIIIIMLCRQHGYTWPSLATPPYRSSLLVGPQGYIPYPYIAAVYSFELVVLLLLGHRRISLMSSSLLLQQCPACLVRLTLIVFVMAGGRIGGALWGVASRTCSKLLAALYIYIYIYIIIIIMSGR